MMNTTPSLTMTLLIVLALLSVLCIRTAGAASDANGEPPVVRSLSSDLSFDENNRLADQVLVYEDSPACASHGMEAVAAAHDDFPIYRVEGYALDKVFSKHTTTGCRAACVERGVDRAYVHDIMPHKYYDNEMPFSDWLHQTCTKVDVCFINYHSKDEPLASFWINEQGERTPHLNDIKYGERHTRCFTSFLNHRFQIEDAHQNLLADLTIRHITIIAFGTSPPSDTRREGYTEYDREIKNTLHNEWKRHQRVTRSFSPLGFKKGRLPNDVFASMGTLYYNNRANVVREEWKGRGVFVNWWETSVFFLQVPWSLKDIYQSRLRALVQDWAGVPVEQTTMYGLRQYTEGARLLTHVDHHQTHAVSLIVNVAQGNLTEPWPVEVQDHEDRLHEVIMEAGDVVYYESAKCLHARNRPLTGPGAYYVNLFTHYKPIVDGEWWHQDNPKGTPEPVLEVEGSCRLAPMGTSQVTTADGQLGLVTGVQCDDVRLGKHISPSLYSATGPEDMIRWWQMTDPNHHDDNGVPASTDDEDSSSSGEAARQEL